MKRRFIVLLCLSISVTQISCTETEPETGLSLDSDGLVLRKMSISKILSGVVNTCLQVVKMAGSKTVKEKQASTCNIIASIIEFAAEAAKKHKKPDSNKCEKTNNNCNNTSKIATQKDNTVQAVEATQVKEDVKITEKTQATENTKLVEPNPQTTSAQPETKAIETGYLQDIQNLSTDEEKADLLNKILQNQEDTEILIDEINTVLKSTLIDALFEN